MADELCRGSWLGANPRLVTRVQQSDLVLLLNAPVSEIPSQGFTWRQGRTGKELFKSYRQRMNWSLVHGGFCDSWIASSDTFCAGNPTLCPKGRMGRLDRGGTAGFCQLGTIDPA